MDTRGLVDLTYGIIMPALIIYNFISRIQEKQEGERINTVVEKKVSSTFLYANFYVHYRYNGTRYHTSFLAFPRAYVKGDKVEIVVSPKDPERLYTYGYLVDIVGIVFGIILYIGMNLSWFTG